MVGDDTAALLQSHPPITAKYEDKTQQTDVAETPKPQLEKATTMEHEQVNVIDDVASKADVMTYLDSVRAEEKELFQEMSDRQTSDMLQLTRNTVRENTFVAIVVLQYGLHCSGCRVCLYVRCCSPYRSYLRRAHPAVGSATC